MARRKEIKGILHSFSSSFKSRNNDIGGYWGLGKLYKHAAAHNKNILLIDVLEHEISPPEKNFTPFIKAYYDIIKKHFLAQGLSWDWLKQVTIVLEFKKEEVTQMTVESTVVGYLGDPFFCKIIFVVDLGRIRSTEFYGRCRQHNATREQRSLRVLKD